MDVWEKWKDKKVFLRTKTNRTYSGKIVEVDKRDIPNESIFLTLIDKFGRRITFATSEIVLIQEEN